MLTKNSKNVDSYSFWLQNKMMCAFTLLTLREVKVVDRLDVGLGNE